MPHRAERQATRRTAAERKLVSVLFADIVGSSAMVSGRDPEDADRELRRVLAILTQAVERYDGTVGQMLGDGMLAIFGAPNAQEDHALRACLAAQEMRAAAVAEGSGFAMRIGIASGEVLAQIIEHRVWADYRTVGECVHLAAKLQQQAQPNSVLLSHETVELVPVGLTVQPAGILRLSESTDPHPVFSLASVRARRRTAADLASGDSGPFVGRERELETLVAAFESACDGVGTTILLSGEAGIGKSRLVSEAMRALNDSGHTLLQWPQSPIRRLGEPDDLELVAASLLPLAGGRDELCRAAAGTGPLAQAALSDLLGLPVEDRVWDGLQPSERLSAAIEGLAATIVALSERAPVLALVEDAHWATPAVRRLLDHFAQAVNAGGRILLIATSRPENGAGWAPAADVLRMPLEALRPEPVQELLDRWLGRDPTLADIKAVVAAKSHGVPLYIEESLRALETAGAIAGVPGHYRLGRANAKAELPASILGLLAARIDSLHADVRNTLLTAAVIGPTFDVGLLQRLESMQEAELLRHLAELEAAAFIRRSRVMPNLEYSFRHGLIQEVAYGTLTRSDRRTLHAHILEALCERHDHDLPGRIELLAHHAYQAEVWPAAYAYGRAAGRRAELRSKLEEASRNYENALAAIGRMPETRRNTLRRIDLSTMLPRALLPRGVTGVEGYLTSARELAQSVGDRARFARASSQHAAFEWVHGDIDKAIRFTREGLAAIAQTNDRETRAQLLCRQGGALTEKGMLHEARIVLEEAQALMREGPRFGRYGMATLGSVAADCPLARSLAELGMTPQAVALAHKAADFAEESGHGFTKVYTYAYLGWIHLLLGNAEPGVSALETALSLSNLMRSRLHQPQILAGLGYGYVLMGEETRGLQLLDRGITSFQEQRVTFREELARIWRADALLRMGRPDDALEEARYACELARRTGRLGYEARASYTLAEAAWNAGRYDTAAANALKNADLLARRLQMAPLAERCALGFGRRTLMRSVVRS